ncbi:MAG: TetR/AcrR family transcriptional regulator [Gammaproteobacteria bacterium]|nr:TetR/AcrR family transcriptional regulator [Gammaproteobacteria bacterium]
MLDKICRGNDFSALTVSGIASEAGVTRKTFYARFGSLEQVVESIVADLFREIAAGITDEMLELPLGDNSLAIAVFKAYETHRDILAPLLRHCPAALFIGPVSAVDSVLLDRAVAVNGLPPLDEARRDYLLATFASITHGVLSVWVERGFSESPEQVARFMDTLLTDGLNKMLTRD